MTGQSPAPPRRIRAARRPPNALGDLLRVAARLRPGTPDVLAQAAVLLGIRSGVTVAEPPEPPPQPPTPPSPPQASTTPGTRQRVAEESSAVRPAGDDPRPPRPMAAEHLPPAALPPRRVRGSVTELLGAEAPPSDARPARVRLAAELFPANHQRAIIGALAAVERPGTEVDLARVLDLLTTRQAIREIPLATTRTTRAGLHLLLDMSPSMRPFLRDLRLLLARARTIVGQEEVASIRFSGTPGWVRMPADGSKEQAYEPPRSPRAVLIATDLGIAAAAAGSVTASRENWTAFAQMLHEAGCPLVLLVPYPPERRPAWSARQFTVVTWDRATTVGQAHLAATRAFDLLRSPR